MKRQPLIRAIVYFIFVFLNPCGMLYAQEIVWQKTIGGNSGEILSSIHQTNDGGVICGGYSNSDISGNKTENSIGLFDYWIVKLDSLGNIQWENTIVGNFHDELSSIAQTDDGGYILGGSSRSTISGDKSENGFGGFDYWIVKLDAAGIIQWQNTIGGDMDDKLSSIFQTSEGGYICGGYSYSDSTGDKSEPNYGGKDYWIIKLDAAGSLQWQNTLIGDDEDILESIQQTIEGGYICGGYSASNISADKSEGFLGGFDYWILKLDSIGNIQWQNTIGGSDVDRLYEIHQTFDGGYICGGFSWSDSSFDKTDNSEGLGYPDYWVVKLDPNGLIQWQNTIGGSLYCTLFSIRQTADSGYVCGGYSNSDISGDKAENSIGINDYWVVRLDSSGNILWQNSIGGDNQDLLNAIVQTTDGGYVLGGYSYSGASGDKIDNSIVSDYWIVKISESFNLIKGNIFSDMNSNVIKDVGETDISHLRITESNSGRYCYSQPDGNYEIAVLDSGNFTLIPQSLNYYIPAPAAHVINFNSINQIALFKDFAIQPIGVVNDLCVTITPNGPFRSGFNAAYQINFSNAGTTTQNATIVFYPDSSVTFVSSLPIPTLITPDSVVYQAGLLSPFQNGQILITVSVNPGLPIGSLINSGTMVYPITGDANPGCNQDWWEVSTTGSIDPNDILVSRPSLFTNEFPNPPYLDYIIRFQNTGNDTAFFVKILNPIDTFKLDLSTLEFITSSHPAEMQFIYYQRNMEFVFNSILLPDSSTNESMSHAFVRYRIKPQTNLILNDTIRNFAAIYFDFNSPVLTNTATTEIIALTSISEINSNRIELYPNPANKEITVIVENPQLSHIKMELYNVYGQQLQVLFDGHIDHGKWKKSFDISKLSSGIYFLKSGEKSERFIKF